MKTIYRDTLPAIEHLFRPKTVAEAVRLLEEYGSDARLLAGGTDLIVLMRERALTPKVLVSITNIRELDFIAPEGNSLKIGALATLRAAELSLLVKKRCLSLHEALTKMAMLQVRNRATVVGNICRSSPAADAAPPLLAAQASVQITGAGGSRTVPLDRFFVGPGQSCLSPQEMVTEIHIPYPAPESGSAFLRASRTAVDLAKVNVAVTVTLQNGTCREARIALGGVAPTPVVAVKAGGLLTGKKLNRELIGRAALTAAEEIKPITDVRSTKEYRKDLSGVLVRRALQKAWERAEHKGEA